MKLYNQNTDKIENIKIIPTDDGVRYVDRLTESELNELGYYKVAYTSPPNRRYYTYTESFSLVDEVYTQSYTAIDKQIGEVHTLMLKDLKEAFLTYSERPKVDTGLGYFVDGGRKDLENFQIGKEFAFEAGKDAEGKMQLVTQSDYDAIILAIKTKGVTLYQVKWAKEAEIGAFATMDECILYEATPYEEMVDVMDEMTLETTQELKTRYKNNVKEW